MLVRQPYGAAWYVWCWNKGNQNSLLNCPIFYTNNYDNDCYIILKNS